MKFTNGFWRSRHGVSTRFAEHAYDLEATEDRLQITAPTRVIADRGAVLNAPVVTVKLWSPMEGIIGVRLEHFTGAPEPIRFELADDSCGKAEVKCAGGRAIGRLVSGELAAEIAQGPGWELVFRSGDRVLTRAGAKSVGFASIGPGAALDDDVVDADGSPLPRSARSFMLAQLDLGIGELVYGFGERFGPLVKNGQRIDVWNSDGGTSSEQAYKNIPFYLTNRGYGVLVNDPGPVSFEVGSEAVERVQFSVPGQSLEFFVIAGDTPAEVIDRYTAFSGRPALVPAWSYGLWLSTSFTTDYDEDRVTSFVDRMKAEGIPQSVLHYDCYWMREFNWCDFRWDPRTFPDPEGMLARMHERGLKICVWINPYIAAHSPLFAEGAEAGYLLRRPDGSVYQCDMWQAGMGLVDFTNPAATAWYQSKLRTLVHQGVDAFKADFGERVPIDVAYHNGADPLRMHNLYTQLYNRAVHEVLVEELGQGQAVLFARSATVGGQQQPVHWGGDNTSTFASMAETLRGGLSLAMSGFGFWSHDIGGFEGTPDPEIFKRWCAFGLLSSHSRLHGSTSYRVPWAFDDEATEVLREFTRLKLRLMPYLWSTGLAAHSSGMPVMRPMALEFPQDPATGYLDRQYMLGPDLLVAPVMSPDGQVDFYLPDGQWTHLLTGKTIAGGRWITEHHDVHSLPLYLRPGAVIPLGGHDDRPDYDFGDGLTLLVNPAEPVVRTLVVENPGGSAGRFEIEVSKDAVSVRGPADCRWSLALPAGAPVEQQGGAAVVQRVG